MVASVAKRANTKSQIAKPTGTHAEPADDGEGHRGDAIRLDLVELGWTTGSVKNIAREQIVKYNARATLWLASSSNPGLC